MDHIPDPLLTSSKKRRGRRYRIDFGDHLFIGILDLGVSKALVMDSGAVMEPAGPSGCEFRGGSFC